MVVISPIAKNIKALLSSLTRRSNHVYNNIKKLENYGSKE